MFRETSELSIPLSVFNSEHCVPLSITSDSVATWSRALFKKRERERERSDQTVKLKKKKKESRKGLTVRENVRLIEASFAQLFLVAVRHCTERLGG